MGSFVRGLVLAFSFVVASAGAASAQRSPDPLVVVIESGDVRIDVVRIRSEIETALELPVVSILEAMNRRTIGTVSVALTERGRRAAVGFMPSDGNRFAVMVEVRATTPTDEHGEWLVAPCVAAVRTSLQRRAAAASSPEVLDPWIASRVQETGETRHEVLDPWVGEPRRRVRVRVEIDDYYLGEDIIDPWAEAVSAYRAEQAERLSRPRRGAANRRTTPAPRRSGTR